MKFFHLSIFLSFIFMIGITNTNHAQFCAAGTATENESFTTIRLYRMDGQLVRKLNNL